MISINLEGEHLEKFVEDYVQGEIRNKVREMCASQLKGIVAAELARLRLTSTGMGDVESVISETLRPLIQKCLLEELPQLVSSELQDRFSRALHDL